MNDKIKQLAEQVGSTHKQNLGVYQFYADELEKFAELIIRECSHLADQAHFKATGGKSAGGYIREQFGVKS